MAEAFEEFCARVFGSQTPTEFLTNAVARAQSSEAALAALRADLEALAGDLDEDVAARIRALLEDSK